MRTDFPIGNGESVPTDTVLTQKTDVQAGEAEADVKFPKSIRHKGKGKVWAKIYAKSKSYPLYRVTSNVKVNGKSRRMVKAFATYADVKRHADARAKDFADGSIVTALTPALGGRQCENSNFRRVLRRFDRFAKAVHRAMGANKCCHPIGGGARAREDLNLFSEYVSFRDSAFRSELLNDSSHREKWPIANFYACTKFSCHQLSSVSARPARRFPFDSSEPYFGSLISSGCSDSS